VKEKVLPWPGTDSTPIVPPWRSTIARQTASPMPVPAYSSGGCSRWKTWKMRSA
jgi:hypothetical protein